MRCALGLLLLAAAPRMMGALQPAEPYAQPQAYTKLHATADKGDRGDDPLAAFASSIDAIWTLPVTGPPAKRSKMARTRKEATHATLWGKKEWAEQRATTRYVWVLARLPLPSTTGPVIASRVPSRDTDRVLEEPWTDQPESGPRMGMAGDSLGLQKRLDT